MSDEAGRRDRRKFEPPPWERGQFEELARLKAEEEARQAAAMAVLREKAQEAAGVVEADMAPDAGVTEFRPVETPTPVAAKVRPVVEDVKLDAMLIELSGEERSALHEFRRAGTVAAWVLASIGAVVLGFGIVLLVRGGAAGLAGAGMIIAVGLFVIGFAVWLGYRASRGQGS
jgi:hypothetical protein